MKLSSVLSVIKPSEKEMEDEMGFSRFLVDYLQENAPPGAEVVLTGSMAKKTFIRDKKDIDVFVLFDRSVPKNSLEEIMKKMMDSAFPSLTYQLSYAEHPYVRFNFEGRRIDLVPAYKISDSSERVSAVDRSVLHTDFILSVLTPEKRDSILLLKQFLKSNSIYGAEIKIQGLSGYLCELLIVKYGSFEKFVKEAAKWKEPVFIDIQKYYKSKKEIEKAVGRLGSGFVVIDPTDMNRNVAAAVSSQNLKRLIKLCSEFSKKPTDDFFFRRPPTFEEQAAAAWGRNQLFVLSMPRPEIVDDVLWGQINKMVSQLGTSLNEFGPKKIIADDSKHLVRLAIILEKSSLPAKMLITGPPTGMKKHVEAFKESHKKAKFKIKEGKIYAEVKRPVSDAKEAVLRFFRNYAKAKSHLSYHEEMIILEYVPKPKRDEK